MCWRDKYLQIRTKELLVGYFIRYFINQTLPFFSLQYILCHIFVSKDSFYSFFVPIVVSDYLILHWREELDY